MASNMSNTKPPYDPVKAIEGMFSGALTRIGYVFQDPANFGPSSKAVLGATSKRFQDVLDDCEVQILDAKSYLEYQLALNKARREAKAQEDGVTAKRKMDNMSDPFPVDGAEGVDHTEVKRQKVEDQPGDSMQIDVAGRPQLEEPPEDTHPEPDRLPLATEQGDASATKLPEVSFPQVTEHQVSIPKAPPDQSTEPRPQTSEGVPRSTPQDTPANEALNFESMFGEPSADAGESNGHDLNFDLDLTADAFGGDSDNIDTSSLSNFLPQLQSYANQAEDDHGISSNSAQPPRDNMTGMDDSIELPDLGNSFDDFFNENNLSGGDGGDGGDEMMQDSNFDIDDQLNFFDT